VSTDVAGRAGASLQGHYAGAPSRLAAFVIDQAVLGLVFVSVTAVVRYSLELVISSAKGWEAPWWVVTCAYSLWWVLYFAVPWAASGKSVGMSVVGIRVVRGDGGSLGVGGALVRAVTLPLGFVTAGLAFVGILVGRAHRGLHDVIAGSVVVYAWDARAATLRVLARPGADGRIA
jgi:uncharacterized RDD family membrane protein YckC